MARLKPVNSNSGKRILLVDDQKSYIDAISKLLIREGHEVVTAQSGEECLALLKDQYFDLLLLDYYMPESMTGEEVVVKLRQFNSLIQIILQTGYAGDHPPREMLKRMDIQGYHDKTDGPEKLLLWVDVGLKMAYAMQLANKSSRGLHYILDVTPDLHKIQPLEELLQGILLQVAGLLGVNDSFLAVLPKKDHSAPHDSKLEGFLAIMEEETDLTIQAATGRFVRYKKVSEFLDSNLIQETFQKGQVQISNTHTIIPLRVGEFVLGIVYLDRVVVEKQDLELLQIFANQAAVSIQNTRLYSLATLDPLTGVYMRRFFEQCLDRELRAAYRLQQPTSLIMFDLDDFKTINDTAGHLTGDQVLAITGHVLRHATRSNDFVGRYGGDEFIILLPQTPLADAEIIVERIMISLGEKRVNGPNEPIQIKASIGVSGIGFKQPEQKNLCAVSKEYFETIAQRLIQKSDEMLYKAKAIGGNCIQASTLLEW